MSGDIHTPTDAGPDPAPPFDDDDAAERPEVFVLGAFAGGLAAAFILKRLTRE